MWLFIPYIVVQVVLWFTFQGDFSVLAKSSDFFVFLATVRSAVNVGGVESVVDDLEDYLARNLYQQFRRKYIRKLNNAYYRHIETAILVIISIVFQFL